MAWRVAACSLPAAVCGAPPHSSPIGAAAATATQQASTAQNTFNPPGKDAKTIDHTHLNAHGAEVIAGIIAEELRKVAPDLAKLLK